MLLKHGPRTRLAEGRCSALLIGSATLLFFLLSYLTIYAPPINGAAAAAGRRRGGGPQDRPLSSQAIMAGEEQQEEELGGSGRERALRAAASNRTLGFDSIQFINLPHRHDRFDSAFLQAYLSGIDLTRFPAVVAAEIQDQGMPPTSAPTRLNAREKACYRAHANVWQHMLEKRIPALLVLESDAAWDVELPDIMARLNGAFRELISEQSPSQGLGPGDADPSDPWMAASGAWDVLQLGSCYDRWQHPLPYKVYHDPHAPHAKSEYDDLPAQAPGQRAVFRAQDVACTTAYAVTLRGAAKMLLRSAFNLEEPVDLVMSLMSIGGDLAVYAVRQRLFAQWAYVPGIGMGARGANSDINNGPADDGADGWDEARRKHSVWGYKEGHENTALRQMAMSVAWDRIIGTNEPVKAGAP